MRPCAALFLVALGSAGCGDESASSGVRRAAKPRARPVVCVTTWPLACMTRRLAAGHADVQCVVPPGSDALHFKPDRPTIGALQAADLIVLNGAGAEPWLFGASLPASRMVDTAYPFRDRYREIEHAVTHSHAGGESHTHSGTDPHTSTLR